MKLYFKNLTKKKISKDFFKKVILDFLKRKKIDSKNLELGILICGERKIRNLNKKYRKIDKVTDVLSFGIEKKVLKKEIPLFLGDIVICINQAEKNAKKLGHSLKEELKILIEHSLSHILS